MKLHDLALQNRIRTVIGSGLLVNTSPELYAKSIVYEKLPDRVFNVYSLVSSNPNILKYGALRGSIDAAAFRGKRISLTAALKTKDADGAGLWVCVFEGEHEYVVDDLPEGVLSGTRDWTNPEIIFDVPDTAKRINYGARLVGKGELLCTEPILKEVDPSLNALTGGKEWLVVGSNPSLYSAELDNAHGMYGLSSNISEPQEYGALRRNFDFTPFLGKRIQLSALINAEDVVQCGLWLRANEPDWMMIDAMSKISITGSVENRLQNLVIDVPAKATAVTYGIYLVGNGSCFMKSPELKIVDKTIALTGTVYGEES